MSTYTQGSRYLPNTHILEHCLIKVVGPKRYQSWPMWRFNMIKPTHLTALISITDRKYIQKYYICCMYLLSFWEFLNTFSGGILCVLCSVSNFRWLYEMTAAVVGLMHADQKESGTLQHCSYQGKIDLLGIFLSTCGWEAALTLAKLKNVGNSLFWTSIPIWRQNDHQKCFSFLAFRDSSYQSRLDWLHCYLWRPKVENFFDAHFVLTWV